MIQKQFHGDRYHSHGRALHALQLQRAGWSSRQISVVMGVGRQRVYQIIWKAKHLEEHRAKRLNIWEIARKQRRANAAVLDGLSKLRILAD